MSNSTPIHPQVLERFNQLRRLYAVAVATSDGLRPEVEHLRREHQQQIQSLEIASRDYGGRIVVEDGHAIMMSTREQKSGATGTVRSWSEHRAAACVGRPRPTGAARPRP